MKNKDKDLVRLCVCATLRKATRTVTQIYDHALRPAGMRATQFQTLMTIAAVGEATVTRLTGLLSIDQTTLTRNLAVLERDGLLREVQKADGRLKSVQLTRQGERALEVAFPLWTQAQKQVTEVLGAAKWGVMRDELERLARLTG